jgi:hypothetical protein
MASDTDDNIIIETSGLTAAVATDVVQFSGATAHFQIFKLAYGICGTANIVTSNDPLPVSFSSGLTATVSSLVTVQGTAGGYPLPVSGTIIATGSTASPVFIRTFTGSQVEVTGGRLYTTADSISVYGPSGATFMPVKLVGSTGWNIGTVGDAIKVSITGATFEATIGTSMAVFGVSGATAISVKTNGNTLAINDTNITNGLTAIYVNINNVRSDLAGISSSLGTLNTNLGTLGISMPTGLKTGRLVATSASAAQMDTSGFSCQYGIEIKSSSSNTNLVYIGNTSGLIGASFGYAMDPGESLFLKLNNTNLVYCISSSGSQVITYAAS